MANNPHEQFFALLDKLPGANKESLVWQYSGMLTTSLKELLRVSPGEYKRMIADLQVKIIQQNKPADDSEIKRLRSSILHRLQKHGVDTTSWSCVNLFLQQPRIAGKRLYEMTVPEMQILIRKLESILAKDANARVAEIKLTESN
jgi:hypothetical protein